MVLFGATVKCTSPVPVPPSELAVTHAAFVAAVHAHDAAEAVTVTVGVAAAASSGIVSGATMNVHGAGVGG